MADELTFYDAVTPDDEPMRDSAFGLIKEGDEQLRLVKFGMTLPLTFESFKVDSLSGYVKVTDRTAEWLQKREEFVKNYERLTVEGIDAGFLQYEYEGAVVPTTDTEEREWVYYDEQDNKEEEK